MTLTVAGISVITNQLRDAVKRLHAASANAVVDVLGNIMIEAEVDERGGRLSLTGANGLISENHVLQADNIEAPLACTVPRQVLLDVVRQLGGGRVTLSQRKQLLVLDSGTANFSLCSGGVEEFPAVFRPSVGQADATLPPMDWKEMVGSALCAVNPEDPVAPLTCLWFNLEANEVEVVGMSHWRICRQMSPLSEYRPTCISFLIPHRSAQELTRWLDYADGIATSVSLRLSGGCVTWTAQGQGLVSHLILRTASGKYPQWRKYIPGAPRDILVMNLKALMGGLRQCMVVAPEISRTHLSTVLGGEVSLTTECPQVGEVSTSVPAVAELDSGDTEGISFCASILYDSLKYFNGEEIRMKLSGPDKPIILASQNDPDYFSLVMPIR